MDQCKNDKCENCDEWMIDNMLIKHENTLLLIQIKA